MKKSPILLPLWAPEAKSRLENFLLGAPNLSLNSTLTLRPDLTWEIGENDARGAFSVRLMDYFDPTKATLQFGQLSAPSDLFSAKNIIKYMQDRAVGTKLDKKLPANDVANDLLELLPPEAVAPLVLSNKGIAYVEMPFTTPFPIRNSGRTAEARMGLLFDGASNNLMVTWRPIEEDVERKVLWSDRSLTKNEINAIRGHAGSDMSYFTLASLASANQPNGTKSDASALMMSYAEPISGNDSNIHSRGLSLAGYSTGLRLALRNHFRFQVAHATSIGKQYFGDAINKTWDSNEQRLLETPWATEEEMLSDLKGLPEVLKSIESGAKPFYALKNFLDLQRDYSRSYSAGNTDRHVEALATKSVTDAMQEAGMNNLASLVFNRKRLSPENNLGTGL